MQLLITETVNPSIKKMTLTPIKSTNKVVTILLMVFSFILSMGQTQREPLDSLLQEYVARKEFNGVVLVAKAGEVIFKKGYGYADFENQIPNTPQTKFSIGSTTKAFTACAIMQQVEKGNLGLHEPISRYIPELKEELGKLTLNHLMKNATGLPVHLNRLTDLEYRDISSSEIIKIYNDKATLSFKPGSAFGYSNLNYQLAALVLERVSGKSYKDYLENTVFKPLKMNNSGVERTFEFPKDKAKGYIVENGAFHKAERNYMAYAKGGGDIYASAEDLLKWDQALYKNEYVSAESKRLLFDGNPTVFDGYGYGFKVKPYDRPNSKERGKLVRHGGSMYGYICNVHRYLDDKMTIIVLGNIRPYPIMEITVGIERLMLGT